MNTQTIDLAPIIRAINNGTPAVIALPARRRASAPSYCEAQRRRIAARERRARKSKTGEING